MKIGMWVSVGEAKISVKGAEASVSGREREAWPVGVVAFSMVLLVNGTIQVPLTVTAYCQFFQFL